MKIIKRLLFLVVALQITAISAMAQKAVKIEGNSSRKDAKMAILFKVVAGEPVATVLSDIQPDGTFGFLFTPQYEGLYMIGTSNDQSLVKNPSGKADLYLKGGEEFGINLTDSVYYLTGKKISKENKAMYNWYQASYQMMTKGIEFEKVLSTYVDFFPELNRVNEAIPNLLKNNKTGNKVFDAYFPAYIDWATKLYAVNMLTTPRKAHPTMEEWDPYYETISVKNLTRNASDFYRFPWAVRLLGSTQGLEIRRNKSTNYRDLDYAMSQTVNDTLKGDVVVQAIEGIKNQDRKAFKETMEKYGKYIVTDAQKARTDVVAVQMAQIKVGDQGMDFEMEDVNGKKVKFSDLKGKIVLIDVWATWCAPCKTEIPFLKKLEEEFKGTDLEVISISIDKVSDKETWKKMVEKEQLGGIQLFANGDQELSKYYKIESIPRFMLFDKEGKIISLNAPRPSTPTLKMQIEALLKRK